MNSLRYRVILVALVLTSCSTAPSDYLTAEGDACQAQRAELKLVEDHYNQSLIKGTAIGAVSIAALGALAGLVLGRGGGTDAAIGAVAGLVAGGAAGYLVARLQEKGDRDTLARTIHIFDAYAAKENIQVNRATAAFATLTDCRFAAAEVIKQSYRQGILSQAEAQAQLSHQLGLFDQDVIYAEQMGAEMQKRNTEFMNAVTEVEKIEAQLDGGDVSRTPEVMMEEAESENNGAAASPTPTPPAKTNPSRTVHVKTTTFAVKTAVESGQDSVQTYNGVVQRAKAEGGSKFNLGT